jgi:hypothetical protein
MCGHNMFWEGFTGHPVYMMGSLDTDDVCYYGYPTDWTQKEGKGATMSQPTQAEDSGQEVHY